MPKIAVVSNNSRPINWFSDQLIVAADHVVIHFEGSYADSNRRTDEELSIVCEADIQIDSAKTSAGWSCIKVIGSLDFSLTGILASISSTLADAKISLFAISTFDTDYFLVKSRELPKALHVLKSAGYVIK